MCQMDAACEPDSVNRRTWRVVSKVMLSQVKTAAQSSTQKDFNV